MLAEDTGRAQSLQFKPISGKAEPKENEMRAAPQLHLEKALARALATAPSARLPTMAFAAATASQSAGWAEPEARAEE